MALDVGLVSLKPWPATTNRGNMKRVPFHALSNSGQENIIYVRKYRSFQMGRKFSGKGDFKLRGNIRFAMVLCVQQIARELANRPIDPSLLQAIRNHAQYISRLNTEFNTKIHPQYEAIVVDNYPQDNVPEPIGSESLNTSRRETAFHDETYLQSVYNMVKPIEDAGVKLLKRIDRELDQFLLLFSGLPDSNYSG